ncbi:hypothetical protein BKA56DRAFT_152239 [Ilyonectria sp. MPI-CAGE-AT-0026]|nr:hypothetical protein BKA56DRAFT_152239 [Ilyonectria sp. MPI-CAGE-AT-0026]
MGIARLAVRLSDCQHARHGYMVPRACSRFRGNGLATKMPRRYLSTLPRTSDCVSVTARSSKTRGRAQHLDPSVADSTPPPTTTTTTTRNRCRQGESALGCHAMSLPFLGSGLGLGTLSSSNPGASQLGPIWMPRRRLWVAKGRPISPEVPIIPKHIRRPPPSPPPTPHLHRRASLGSGVRSRQVDSEPSRDPCPCCPPYITIAHPFCSAPSSCQTPASLTRPQSALILSSSQDNLSRLPSLRPICRLTPQASSPLVDSRHLKLLPRHLVPDMSPR